MLNFSSPRAPDKLDRYDKRSCAYLQLNIILFYNRTQFIDRSLWSSTLAATSFWQSIAICTLAIAFHLVGGEGDDANRHDRRIELKITER
jgi:hypothetical protein